MSANPEANATSKQPVLSVVVIGRNEGHRLVRCLESVAATRRLNGIVEVIYVDSSSTDNSVQNAAQCGARVINVKPERPCASIGRNAGWRAARAAIVLFLDGDTILHPDFVADSIGEFDDANVAMVFGDCREVDPAGSIYNRVLNLEWFAPTGPVNFCGGNVLIRRDVLERVNGYDEQLIAGEDTELCWRIRSLGYTVLHVDRPMVEHDLAITRFVQYWRRAVRSGHAYAEVSTRVGETDSPLSRQEARRKLIHGISLLSLLIGSSIICVIFRIFWPMLIAILLFVLISVRTTVRFPWKSPQLTTRLLFGFHSHLVKIPILLGQLKYRYNRRRGKKEALIEYKDVPRVATNSTISVGAGHPKEASSSARTPQSR